MAVVNLRSDFAKTEQTIVPYTAHALVNITGNIESNSGDSILSTYDFGLIPANAYLNYSGSGYNIDAIATTTTPKISFGLFGVDGNLSDLGYSDDDDCLKSAFSVNSSLIDRRFFVDFPDYELPLWQLISGVDLTKRVKGSLRLKATLSAGALDTGGSIGVNIAYYVK